MIRMIIAAIVAACTLAIALPAQSADIQWRPSYYQSQAPSTFYAWNSLYGGPSVGNYRADERETYTDRNTNYLRDLRTKGWTFGGTLGFNKRLGNWVFGLETDGYWMNTKGSSTETECVDSHHGRCQLTFTTVDTTHVNWMGTTRGRIGYAFDRLMPYLTAGIGYGSMTNDHDEWYNSGSPFHIKTKQYFGGLVGGGGIEWMFAHNISAKVEYLFGEFKTLSTVTSSSTYDESLRNNHQIKFGVNFHLSPN